MRVAVNEKGRRVGDSHHNAKLTNHEVELLLAMYGEGMGYRRLSTVFEVSKTLVRNIVKGRARVQAPSYWRTVHVSAGLTATVRG